MPTAGSRFSVKNRKLWQYEGNEVQRCKAGGTKLKLLLYLIN
jgi:hypothetical protein